MVRIPDLRATSRWIRTPKKLMVVTGRPFKFNSLLSSDKVSPLTREQTPRSRKGINNVEYKLHDPAQGLIMRIINSTTRHKD